MPKVVKSLLLWVVLLAVPLQGEAKTYLLSVGISDYPAARMTFACPTTMPPPCSGCISRTSTPKQSS